MDYQGNTNKSKEEKEKKAEKNTEKVITGEVIQKPKSLGHKFKETFFGGDAKTAARYVTSDVLLPALRNLIVDSVTKGAERLVFGESMSRRGPRPTDYRSRFEYRRPQVRSQGQIIDIQASPPDQRPGAWRTRRREFNDIVLTTREDAELIVEKLIEFIEKYDVVSLLDLYELLGQPSSPLDAKWGWSYLSNVEIRQIREGYLIELPSLQEL